MGVTGSGKTTIGQLLTDDVGWNFLDADDFHPATNIEKMKRGVPLNDTDREPWLLRLRETISHCLERNQPAVLACSALKECYRKLLLIDERVQLVYLQSSSDVIEERLANRSGHYMNPVLLDSQFAALEEPVDCLRIDASAPPQEIVTRIKAHFNI
jgi:gluconokinase